MKKNIFEVERSVVKKFIGSEKGVRLLSLIIAFIIFLLVNSKNLDWNNFFLETKYIENVPLETKYDSKYVVEGVPESIAVMVTGTPNSVESAINTKELIRGKLTVDTTAEGVQKINAKDIISFNQMSGVTIKPVVDTIDVTVQKKIEKQFSINIIYANGDKAKEKFTLSSPTLSATAVVVNGGSRTVEEISNVNAIVDLAKISPDDSTTAKIEAPLIAYDSNGNVVENVAFDNKSIIVDQPYEISTVTRPIQYSITNNQKDQFVASICSVENKKKCEEQIVNGVSFEETTDLYGDTEKIKSITQVEYQIDLQNYSADATTYKARAILPANVFSTKPEIEVNIKFEKGIAKDITNIPVQINNLASNLSAKAVTPEDATISVAANGAESIINKMTRDDLIVFVDLSKCTGAEICTVPLQYRVTNFVTITLKKERVQMKLSEKE